MILRSPLNHEEIAFALDIYISMNDESVIPSNREHALKVLYGYITNRAYFKLIEYEDDIVGFVLADLHKPDMHGLPVARQIFYASNLKTVKAVKALVLAHEGIIEWGRSRGAKHVYSSSSHMDSSNQLCRILAKHGWRTYNYLAIYDL